MWLGIKLLQIHCLYTSINPKLAWALFACTPIPCLGFGPKVEQKNCTTEEKADDKRRDEGFTRWVPE